MNCFIIILIIDIMFVLRVMHRYYTYYPVAFSVSFVHPILSRHKNWTRTFVLMSAFIILSGVNSGTSIGDFCVCEDEHFVCTPC